MLTITTIEGQEIEWHIGEKVPDMWGFAGREHDALQRISSITADGDELGHIREIFHSRGTHFTVPMPNKPVSRWYGDIARTIYLNL